MTTFPDFSQADIDITDGEFTDEQEKAYAHKAKEALPELRRRAGLIPGGKSLSGDGKHSPVVQVVLSESHRTQLATEAAKAGMSVSKYARRIIEAHLAP